MSTSTQIDRLLAEESAEWTERLKHGDRHTRAAFAKWSLKSPLHMRHFLMMVALDQELEQIDPEKRIPLSPPSDRPSAEVISIADRAAEPPRVAPSRNLRWWALAAAFLFAIAAVLYVPSFIDRAQGWEEYSTRRGEQRAVELADGSIAHLNTDSRVQVRLSEQERQVRLLSGEALFKVHHDTSRPFRVYTDAAMIQAVGTQFNVYRQSGGTRVAVLEGRVRVLAEDEAPKTSGSAAAPEAAVEKVELLGAGEVAEVHSDGTISKSEEVDVDAMAAWRERRLVFKQEPLASVVTEFNRYNRTPRFRIVGADVASRRYSGAFDADDPESLVALLAIDKDLQVQRDGEDVIVRARNPASSFAQSP